MTAYSVSMSNWVGVAMWLLAAVFATSGVAKVVRPIPAAVAMMNFGVTRSVRRRAAYALGIAETILAITIASGALPRLALGIAAGLLAVFSGLIALTLVRGRRFSCGCFGAEGAPLSGWTLARTASLLLISVLALNRAGASEVASSFSTELLEAVTGVALFGAAALVSTTGGLVRWNAISYPPQRRVS